MEVAGQLLEPFERFGRVVDKHILVHYVVTAKQQPYGRRKAEAAVRAVRGEALIPGVCLKASGQVVHIRKGVQA